MCWSGWSWQGSTYLCKSKHQSQSSTFESTFRSDCTAFIRITNGRLTVWPQSDRNVDLNLLLWDWCWNLQRKFSSLKNDTVIESWMNSITGAAILFLTHFSFLGVCIETLALLSFASLCAQQILSLLGDSCGQPPAENISPLATGDQVFNGGNAITIMCLDGYRLNGGSTSYTSVCMDNGAWTVLQNCIGKEAIFFFQRTLNASCHFKFISSRIAGPSELFSSDFRACARSPRWKTRCSFCLLKSVAAAMQQLDHRSTSKLP